MSENNSGPEANADEGLTLTERIKYGKFLTDAAIITEVKAKLPDNMGALSSPFASLRGLVERTNGIIRDQPPEDSCRGQRSEYIRAIQDVDASLDRIVTASDIEQETGYTVVEIAETFGSWRSALDAAGIDVRSQIRLEIARLYRKLGHPPSPAEMNEHGHLSATFIENTFESYDEAIAQVVQETAADRSRFSWLTHKIGAGTNYTGRLAGQGRAFLTAILARLRRLLGGVTIRLSNITSASVLPERSGQLVIRIKQVSRQWIIAIPTRAWNRLRSDTPTVDQERRNLLKYAGTSLTLSVVVSSSDSLYGPDRTGVKIVYGYGGIPATSNTDTDQDEQSGAMVSTPNETQSPSAGEVTTLTPTPVPTSTTVANPSGGEEPVETNPTNSDPDSDTVTESTATPTQTQTENVTDTAQTDRYYSDFSSSQQGYGEGGYGGVPAT